MSATNPDEPHPEQLPAAPPPPVRKYNIRKMVPSPQGDASVLLGSATAATPAEAFAKWLKTQTELPGEDIYRVLEAGVVSRFDFKHNTTGAYTEVKPPV